MAYSAFQSNAFQRNAFQIGGSGESAVQTATPGFPAYDSEADRFRRFIEREKRLRERFESLPESVRDVAEDIINKEDSDRKLELRRRVSADAKFIRLYEAIIEDYRAILLEYDLAIAVHNDAIRRRNEDDAICLLLLE